MSSRWHELLQVLEATRAPVSGAELATRMGVSARSVRQYVSGINQPAGTAIVDSSHRGYSLNTAAYEVWAHRRSAGTISYDGPRQRLYFITRNLITHVGDGTDVFDLADLLSVSPSTIEADLARAREMLRELGLHVRREHDRLYLEGSERNQRRLVRQLVLDASRGTTPHIMQAFAATYEKYDTRALARTVQGIVTESELEVDEYFLNDLVIHLTIAADRVSAGHSVTDSETSDASANEVVADEIARQLAEAVRKHYGVRLPESETLLLSTMLSTRVESARRSGSRITVNPDSLHLVRAVLHELSAFYLVDLYNEDAVVDLAFHVEYLVKRAKRGQSLQNPIGEVFKNTHPLIHEVALFFADQLEKKASVKIGPGEVDFLSFHLGTQLQRQLEQGPPVTVTLVAIPPYGRFPDTTVGELSSALGDQAVIVDVVSTLDYDWHHISSDLIISTVNLSGLTAVPAVYVSALLRQEDIDQVQEAVKLARLRGARQRIRSGILTLIEPGLFHHVEVVTKTQALEMMCHTLTVEGVVPSSFFGDVIEREERSNTAFGGQFAIPHSMKMDASRSAISILLSNREIPWGDSNVRIVVMLALNTADARVFRDVLGEFIPILADPENLTALLSAENSKPKHFIRTLAELLG